MKKYFMSIAAYSQTPLAKKLGIKPGFKLRLINAPAHYLGLFTDMPAEVEITSELKLRKDLIHFFAKNADELQTLLLTLKNEIVPNGMIWVSWPKKASKVPTDVSEDMIRNLALSIGLVDIKVCAVDETWSGLKLVIPVKDRKG